MLATLDISRQALWLVCCLMCCQYATAQEDRQQSEQELQDVQRQIKLTQAEIQQQLKDARNIEQRLKRDELAIAKTAKSLNQTRSDLKSNHRQQAELNQQKHELEQQKQQQQSLLADLIRSAYMTGKHDYLKLLFSQEDAGTFERVNSYYQYLNHERVTEIRRFGQLIEQLQDVTQQLQKKQLELTALEDEQRRQSTHLKQQQNRRQQTLRVLNSSIKSDSAQVEALQLNEQALLSAIQQAKRRADREKQIAASLQGLEKLKGKVIKPANGRTRQLFGGRRQGQVRWKGIIIESNAGSSVRAVHQGTVLYADWLKGFGLVTVIDHGKGYMSLYGHNQALLKQVGNSVEAGETIALVGQSGGQSAPGLYFEIRHKGKAINPKGWFRGR